MLGFRAQNAWDGRAATHFPQWPSRGRCGKYVSGEQNPVLWKKEKERKRVFFCFLCMHLTTHLQTRLIQVKVAGCGGGVQFWTKLLASEPDIGMWQFSSLLPQLFWHCWTDHDFSSWLFFHVELPFLQLKKLYFYFAFSPWKAILGYLTAIVVFLGLFF